VEGIAEVILFVDDVEATPVNVQEHMKKYSFEFWCATSGPGRIDLDGLDPHGIGAAMSR
jgi:hypothetical protein